MTWSSVQPQLVTIIEGTTLATSLRVANGRGRSSSLRHESTATDESLPQTRGFWLRLASMSVSGNTPVGRAYRQRDVVTVSIAYKRDVDAADLEVAIASDYQAICRRLVDPANWARSTSTIVAIEPEAQPQYLTATIEDLEGARILRLSVVVEHTV